MFICGVVSRVFSLVDVITGSRDAVFDTNVPVYIWFPIPLSSSFKFLRGSELPAVHCQYSIVSDREGKDEGSS